MSTPKQKEIQDRADKLAAKQTNNFIKRLIQEAANELKTTI